jgi:hypothetical protein
MPVTAKKPPVGQFTVQWIALDKVKRYVNNPRVNKDAVQAVRRSLDEFGWRQPIVVDKHWVIVVGDTRYLAAKQRGDAQVPVHVAADLTPDQARAYRIADNKVGEIAGWNEIKLISEIAELTAANFDLKTLGFSAEEIEEFSKVEKDNRYLEDFDLTPKPVPVWIMVSTDESEAAKIIHTLEKLGLKSTRIESTLKP